MVNNTDTGQFPQANTLNKECPSCAEMGSAKCSECDDYLRGLNKGLKDGLSCASGKVPANELFEVSIHAIANQDPVNPRDLDGVEVWRNYHTRGDIITLRKLPENLSYLRIEMYGSCNGSFTPSFKVKSSCVLLGGRNHKLFTCRANDNDVIFIRRMPVCTEIKIELGKSPRRSMS